MRFYDLFAGIGGFRLGLERAGHECVGSCEINETARAIYTKHFEEPTESDIGMVDATTLRDFDILTAGFPCQAFSYAGKRMGFSDSRGNLFFEIIRVAKEKRPSTLLLENVRGLLSHDRGYTFGRILYEMDQLGYDTEWQVINGKHYVPQNRERLFIIGHLRGQSSRQVFPIGATQENNTGLDEGRSKKQPIVNCIDSNYHKGIDKHSQRTVIVMLAHTKANIKQRIQSSTHCWTIDTGGSKVGILENNKLRKLTPLECERLMGFPDNWTIGFSDTQRYKCLGNSVIIPIIEEIGKAL